MSSNIYNLSFFYCVCVRAFTVVVLLHAGYDVNQDTLLALKKLSTASAADASATKKTGAASAQRSSNGANKNDAEAQNTAASTSDGLAEIEVAAQLRFTEDDRVHEVCFFEIFQLVVTQSTTRIHSNKHSTYHTYFHYVVSHRFAACFGLLSPCT